MRLTLPLQTERLVIKQFTEQDEESYYQLLSDEDYIKYLGSPVTQEQANRQLQRVIEGYGSSGLGALMAYEPTFRRCDRLPVDRLDEENPTSSSIRLSKSS